MDQYFEVLEKSKNSIALNIVEQMGFDETADVLEKGRAAQMGEMRIWNGVKYQKTPKGWIPVKGEQKSEKKEPEAENKEQGNKKSAEKQEGSEKKSVFIEKLSQEIKRERPNWSDETIKDAEKVLSKHESSVKKFMSISFPAADYSFLLSDGKKTEIDGNEIIFKTVADRDKTKYHYQVSLGSKVLANGIYNSGSKWTTASKVKNSCKIDALLRYLHIGY